MSKRPRTTPAKLKNGIPDEEERLAADMKNSECYV